MPYIYKITNKLNNKVYIGKTLESVDKRWAEHLHDYNRDRNKDRPLYRAMKKYGCNNFEITTVEECSVDELNNREQYWISMFDSFKHGYNATIGGDGKAFVDSDFIIYLWNNGLNIKQIKNQTGYDCCTIRKYLSLNGITKQEIHNRLIKERSMPVAMIDKNSGEIIKMFSSIADAGREMNDIGNHIASVCVGNRKSAYGYIWKHLQ